MSAAGSPLLCASGSTAPSAGPCSPWASASVTIAGALAQVLLGGGIGTLCTSGFAAFQLYRLAPGHAAIYYLNLPDPDARGGSGLVVAQALGASRSCRSGYRRLRHLLRRALIAGLRFGHARLLCGALATLLLVVGKLFFVDLAKVDAVWRVPLFFGFGGLFLALSYYLHSLWRTGSSAGEGRQ